MYTLPIILYLILRYTFLETYWNIPSPALKERVIIIILLFYGFITLCMSITLEVTTCPKVVTLFTATRLCSPNCFIYQPCRLLGLPRTAVNGCICV
jgi:hypothetical protein